MINRLKMKKLLVFVLLIITFCANGQTAKEYYDKGTAKANSHEFEESIKDFDEAIKIDPKYIDAYYNRGTSKLYLKDYKNAITDLDKAIELKPDFAKAYANRGIAKVKLDDVTGAIKDFDMALKIDPDNASSYFMRGQFKLQLGDAEGGCLDLTKANNMGDKRAQKFIQQYCAGQLSSKSGAKQNESLELNWPDEEGWKIASNQEDKEHKVVELLRNNETLDAWTEIGTMMIYLSLKNVPVDAAMNAMYEQAKKSCPSAKLTFIEKDEKDKYPWILFKIECGADNPESQVWYITQGANGMYVNFRAVKQKTIPDNIKDKWVSFFKTSKIVVK
jgi:Flp pilus assembly protein TadD